MDIPQKSLGIRVRKVRNAIEQAAVVDLSGNLDALTATDLRDTLLDLVNQGHLHILLKMSQVQHLDSAGLGSLINGYKRLREHHGTLGIVSPSDTALQALAVTGLDTVFHIYASELWALEAVPRVARSEYRSSR